MFTFYYNTTKTFDQPGPNQPPGAITTYYRSNDEEIQNLTNYVYQYFKEMESDFISNPVESAFVYDRPLKNHRKKNKKHYTVKDAIADINIQLEKGKDPTESMINRWNSAFCELGVSDASIIVKRGIRPSVSDGPRIPNKVFMGLFDES